MKVYLDDVRQEPDGYVRAYTARQAIDLLKGGTVELISLDHDLGNDEAGTGYTVASWIEEETITKGFVPPLIMVHSANSVGRRRIEQVRNSLQRFGYVV